MMNSSHRSPRFALLMLGLVVPLSGCFAAAEDCTRALTCDVGDPGSGGAGGAGGAADAGPRCIADPTNAMVADDCGIFASSSLGDDKNEGTQKAPVKTIGQALALAAYAKQRVYACAELFPEAVSMPAGFTLFGGFRCNSDLDWAYIGASQQTIIKPTASAVALTLLQGAGGSIFVTDVQAEGPNASEPGASSIAALANAGALAELRRCTLIANHGATGKAGEPGDTHNTPADTGTPGKAGADACTADMVSGGAQVKTSCGGPTSIGAQGGNGGPTLGTTGADGQPAPAPNPLGHGLGGTGDGPSLTCLEGATGADGANGQEALGAHGSGHISENGYAGVAGQDGSDGLPGQGGGGGGGRKAGALFCGAGPKGGAAGGSGGSGGCGGKGGKGGGPGGASIALVSLAEAKVVVFQSHLKAGDGGNGGLGGVNQIGGAPGIPGAGGMGENGSGFGCFGGQGGKGGNGGNGGGGLGGPSIAVAYVGVAPEQSKSFMTKGKPGKGGLGGNPNLMGSSGDDATADETLQL